jgi:asparagine synthase (glutamine-hydrolysing)
MCGIAGILASGQVAKEALFRMTRPLAHRGPDDFGWWIDSGAGIGLGHRRLSIVDLSPAGHQPMLSADGRFVLTYNGEIYNFEEIRREIETRSAVPDGGWRGHSDTEVLLQAIVSWGLSGALEKAVGMFAFALWDKRERTLSLVRDRFGEKPLYYGWAGEDFVFASELKAIRAHPKFNNEIDRSAVRMLAARTYIPPPLSIYRRLFKLPPGHILTVPAAAAASPLDEAPMAGGKGPIRLAKYWSYRDVVSRGLADPIRDEEDSLAALDEALGRAVRGQSVADVPVGMFLSGGIDSSTVAALYQRYSTQPVRTFSIGFEDSRYDEARFARRVAERLGTVHHEQILTDRDALEVIPLLPSMYDEPFADSSQIPTYLVSRMARSQVTVALTGDGGDELFGGYYRHFYAPRLWRQVRALPRAVRAGVMGPLSRLPSSIWNPAGILLGANGRSYVGAKIQKGLRLSASARDIDDVYAAFLDEWSFEPSPVLHAANDGHPFELNVPGATDEERLMYCDAVSYLPGDILCKVDRASMAVSLETRVPFLDHRLAAVAARIPVKFKISGGKGKQIVRKLLYRQAPRELFERPKAGFGIPLGEWLRGPLRDWAESLLEERRLSREGWFDSHAVQRRWRDHLNGRRDSPSAIWSILMFQAWLDEQRAPPSINEQSARTLALRPRVGVSSQSAVEG